MAPTQTLLEKKRLDQTGVLLSFFSKQRKNTSYNNAIYRRQNVGCKPPSRAITKTLKKTYLEVLKNYKMMHIHNSSIDVRCNKSWVFMIRPRGWFAPNIKRTFQLEPKKELQSLHYIKSSRPFFLRLGNQQTCAQADLLLVQNSPVPTLSKTFKKKKQLQELRRLWR